MGSKSELRPKSQRSQKSLTKEASSLKRSRKSEYSSVSISSLREKNAASKASGSRKESPGTKRVKFAKNVFNKDLEDDSFINIKKYDWGRNVDSRSISSVSKSLSPIPIRKEEPIIENNQPIDSDRKSKSKFDYL